LAEALAKNGGDSPGDWFRIVYYKFFLDAIYQDQQILGWDGIPDLDTSVRSSEASASEELH
jgi:hypothetical protein